MNIQESLRIGDYGYSNVYDIKVINNNVHIAITNWDTINQVAILDSNESEIGLYNTGIIPTDFEIWRLCTPNGDYNQDNEVNIIRNQEKNRSTKHVFIPYDSVFLKYIH